MTTPRVIHLTAPKGGQGTTTTAVALAAALAEQGETVTVLSDLDAFAVAGAPNPGHDDTDAREVADRLHIAAGTGIAPGTTVAIVDRPALLAWLKPSDLPRANYVAAVVRPCYIALRRFTARTWSADVDAVLLLTEPGRALDRRDVQAVTDRPVIATIPVDPSTARAVDAGILTRRARTHAEYRRAADALSRLTWPDRHTPEHVDARNA